LSEIKNRVQEINSNIEIPQLAIFPEGGTSNGLFLLKFKRGAFEALQPILPIFMEYYSPYCNPACEIIPIHLNLLFMACQPFTALTIHRMPIVFPTEFMFTNNKNIFPKPEIYADTVREIYSEAYSLEKVPNSHLEKEELKKYLFGPAKSGSITKKIY